MKLSSKALACGQSPMRKFHPYAVAAAAAGKKIYHLNIGQPDIHTPDALYDAIHNFRTPVLAYAASPGIPELIEAIRKYYENIGVGLDESDILITTGGSEALQMAANCLLDDGDEVIVPAPYWVSYCEMVSMLGGVPVPVLAEEAQHFKITPAQLEAAVTAKTKAVMLNNPCNPTGMFYTKSELEALAEVCVKHDLYVIADEIYYQLLYDGLKFTSFASLGDEVKERTILINGVSKSYAMTGWRIGYAAANKEIAKTMSNYLSHSTGAPSTISQWAAVEALSGPQETIEAMRKVFEERRNYLVSRLNSIPGVSCITPNGAFYVMMNIEKLIGRTLGGRLIENDDDFGVAFLEKGLVAVVPCSGFGIKNFVRWTYATSMENIKEGLDRLEKFLAE